MTELSPTARRGADSCGQVGCSCRPQLSMRSRLVAHSYHEITTRLPRLTAATIGPAAKAGDRVVVAGGGAGGGPAELEVSPLMRLSSFCCTPLSH